MNSSIKVTDVVEDGGDLSDIPEEESGDASSYTASDAGRSFWQNECATDPESGVSIFGDDMWSQADTTVADSDSHWQPSLSSPPEAADSLDDQEQPSSTRQGDSEDAAQFSIFSREPERLNFIKARLLQKGNFLVFAYSFFCCGLILCLVMGGLALSLAGDRSPSASASSSALTPGPTVEPVLPPSPQTQTPTTGAAQRPESPSLMPNSTVTPSPTEATTLEPTTLAPTNAPSQTSTASSTATSTPQYPTEQPTSAPPSIAPLPFPASLAGYTQEALQDVTSPQSRAMVWLDSARGSRNFPDWRKEQLFALVTFYYSYNGDDWSASEKDRWLNPSYPECEWGDLGNKANVCDDNGRITTLSLESQSGLIAVPVDGAITPPELVLLEYLERLQIVSMDLYSNLTSVLPTQIGTLQNLRDIRLINNEMRGTIPSYLGGSGLFHQLTNLNLRTNDLSGSLPSELGLLNSTLKFLTLRDNFLSGSVPSELGSLSGLESLVISGNDLTGTLPLSICELPLLTTLKVDCLKIVCPDECNCDCQDP